MHTHKHKHKHMLHPFPHFTSMWEELGVYLLECVLIHNPTGTLLESEADARIKVTDKKLRWI